MGLEPPTVFSGWRSGERRTGWPRRRCRSGCWGSPTTTRSLRPTKSPAKAAFWATSSGSLWAWWWAGLGFFLAELWATLTEHTFETKRLKSSVCQFLSRSWSSTLYRAFTLSLIHFCYSTKPLDNGLLFCIRVFVVKKIVFRVPAPRLLSAGSWSLLRRRRRNHISVVATVDIVVNTPLRPLPILRLPTLSQACLRTVVDFSIF